MQLLRVDGVVLSKQSAGRPGTNETTEIAGTSSDLESPSPRCGGRGGSSGASDAGASFMEGLDGVEIGEESTMMSRNLPQTIICLDAAR